MPWVVTKIDRKGPGFPGAVFTLDELQRMASSGSEITAVNVASHHLRVFNRHPSRKKLGGRFIYRIVYEGEVAEQLTKLGFSETEADDLVVGALRYYGQGRTPREAAERIYDIYHYGHEQGRRG
jgi:hypothetical protein